MIFFFEKKGLKTIFFCYYMTTFDNANLAKTSEVFYCNCCYYSTSRKYNYNLHLDSAKHKNNVSNNGNNNFLAKHSKTYVCSNCTRTYNDRAGLWRHKKNV